MYAQSLEKILSFFFIKGDGKNGGKWKCLHSN